MIMTKRFWLIALERALKSVGQLVGAYLAATALPESVGFGAEFTVAGLALAGLFGFVSSIALSLASAPVGEKDSPMVINEPDPVIQVTSTARAAAKKTASQARDARGRFTGD